MKISKSSWIILIFLSIAVQVTITVSYFLFSIVEEKTKEDMQQSLESVLNDTDRAVKVWFNELKDFVRSWGTDENTVKLTQELKNSLNYEGGGHFDSPNAMLEILSENRISPKVQSSLSRLVIHLESSAKVMIVRGYLVISPDKRIIAASEKANLGRKDKLLQYSGLIDEVLAKGETVVSLPHFSDLALYDGGKLRTGIRNIIFMAPISNKEEEIISILAINVAPEKSFSELFQSGRVDKSGEIYAFNKSAKLISESRFQKELQQIGLIEDGQSSILNLEIRDPGVDLTGQIELVKSINLRRRPLTKMAESAIFDGEGVDMEGYRNYWGVEVVGVWMWNEVYGYGIAAEVDKNEAYDVLQIIKHSFIAGNIIIIMTFIILSYFLNEYINYITVMIMKDRLTGLPNRRKLETKLEFELAHLSRLEKPISVCMIDIDYFKSLNDSLGHLEGDRALKQVALTIQSVIMRRTDLVCRYGGEEFCIILPDTTCEQAVEIGEKVRIAVLNAKIGRNRIEGFEWLTISVGVNSLVPNDNTTSEELIDGADKALYEAKHSGRNCTKAFSHSSVGSGVQSDLADRSALSS